jgi:hypothetical protein
MQTQRTRVPADPLAIATRATVVAAAILLSGCSSLPPVQPWEKGHLAKPAMTFENDRLDSAFLEHTYGSKEATSGGAGVGGGGCGCN